VNRPIPTPGAVAGTTSTEDVLDWRTRAACLDHDPELFFAPDQERANRRNPRVAEAKAICATCPVQQACLRWAVENGIPYGVWGGLDEDERGTSRRPAPKAAPARKPPAPAKLDPITRPGCGRQRGYEAHTANGERQCDVCKAWRARGKRIETQAA
jgi:WhiB family redox-sensing transcriptional regulator